MANLTKQILFGEYKFNPSICESNYQMKTVAHKSFNVKRIINESSPNGRTLMLADVSQHSLVNQHQILEHNRFSQTYYISHNLCFRNIKKAD